MKHSHYIHIPLGSGIRVQRNPKNLQCHHLALCQGLLYVARDIKSGHPKPINQLLSKQSTASRWYSSPFVLTSSLA